MEVPGSAIVEVEIWSV